MSKTTPRKVVGLPPPFLVTTTLDEEEDAMLMAVVVKLRANFIRTQQVGNGKPQLLVMMEQRKTTDEIGNNSMNDGNDMVADE